MLQHRPPKQSIDYLVIWDALTLVLRHYKRRHFFERMYLSFDRNFTKVHPEVPKENFFFFDVEVCGSN